MKILDNVFWYALTGAQADFADGHGKVRRYREGFSPIAAFEDPDNPEFKTLERFCDPGDSFYCDGWSGPKPRGWDIKAESTMFKMLWNEATPRDDDARDAVKIGPQHREQVLELVELTRPGRSARRRLSLAIISVFSMASAWWRWPVNVHRRRRCARSAACARILIIRVAAWRSG